MTSIFRSLTTALSVVVGLTLTSPANADDLATVKEAGSLRIAMSGAFPPFSFVDEQNNVVGFDVDIGTEIAKRIGVKAEIVTTPWDGIIAGLLAGKFDTIVGSMSITEERSKSVDFVGPYYHGGRGLFVPNDSDAQSVADLKGRTIGVILGETHEAWARALEGVTVTTYKGVPELLLEANSGRVDAIVTDEIPLLVAVKERGLPLREINLPDEGAPDRVGIAIRKENPELAAAMQKALDDMQKDGTYEAISMKWIGKDIR